MQTLVIGDIHGCLKALETLVEYVKISPNDTVVTLGDYIDRGPDSKGVLDYLLAFRKTHHLIPLKGNHEEMMENAQNSFDEAHFWLTNGGSSTLDSFQADNLDDIPQAYWDFISSCSRYYETDTHILAHGGLEPNTPLEEQPDKFLLWQRIHETQPHQSGKTLVCGHTPQRDGKPLVLDHAICIDTFVFGINGWLTCLELETGTYWQANQRGETRKSMI